MLRVMENCDNPLVKFLAGEIKKSMISAERGEENPSLDHAVLVIFVSRDK